MLIYYHLLKNIQLLNLIPLTTNIYMYLPLSLTENLEKSVIMGSSVNQYINNKKIVLYTSLVDNITGITNYYTITFSNSGEYINLISICNLNNKYYQLLNYSFYDKTLSLDLSENIKTIVNNDSSSSNQLISYSESELDKVNHDF